MNYPRRVTELEEMQALCREWLDNADLSDCSLNEAGDLELKFIVGGDENDVYWVDIKCEGLRMFNLLKDPESDVTYVGGVIISRIGNSSGVLAAIRDSGWNVNTDEVFQPAYLVTVEGGIEIRAVCDLVEMWERREAVANDMPAGAHFRH